MNAAYEFEGIIRNVRYTTCLRSKLVAYPFEQFDPNLKAGSALVSMDTDGSTLGFSKWKSPKRTRTYPFARIYSTYHLPKRVTLIPVIKDEGINGDNDRVNFITLSWMNLLNVYIILAWYDDAEKHRRRTGKIANQRFNADYVSDKLQEIYHYQQTALHWNMMHFDRDFVPVFHAAVDSYQRITQRTGVAMHPAALQLKVLDSYLADGRFDRALYREATLSRSQHAARRELSTTHRLELLEDGAKGLFLITNMLGGEYHLTADEIYHAEDKVVIQESKNASRGKLPGITDIQDGLFKLILFANMDELRLGGQLVSFVPRLKLTGRIEGALRLPTMPDEIAAFGSRNRLSSAAQNMLALLNDEALQNPPLEIVIGAQE